ncbi:MAG TPA: SPOR domain-containing protein [Sphingobium sp.]|nr:SPOR domain-containing protein [Sphingobium sp.]
MAGQQSDGFNLDDDDRLPWLEPASDEGEAEGVPLARLLLLILLGLVLLGVVVGGGYWLKSNDAGGDGSEARLIAADGPDYKVPATAADAKAFDGEGDAAFDASEGREAVSRIDASQVPEAPRTDLTPATVKAAEAPKPAAAKPTVVAAVKTVAAEPRKVVAAAAPVASEGPRIQLGAFGSKALAESVWKKSSARFDYLAPLSHYVEPVETGGKTLFRLRVIVASAADAGETCGKLRVAGESCMVVR